MSKHHLKALEGSLAQRGWRVIAVHDGDGHGISATWEIQRSTKCPTLLIDFDGMEPMGRWCLPLEESYGCRVRDHHESSLKFRRVHSQRELWNAELVAFMNRLEELAREESVNAPAPNPDAPPDSD